jgi:hypothetical protein
MLVTRTNYARIFADFDTTLPVVTTWILAVPGSIVVSFALGFGLVLLLKEFTIRIAAFALSVNVAIGMLLLTFVTIFYLAMLAPLNMLIQQLQ